MLRCLQAVDRWFGFHLYPTFHENHPAAAMTSPRLAVRQFGREEHHGAILIQAVLKLGCICAPLDTFGSIIHQKHVECWSTLHHDDHMWCTCLYPLLQLGIQSPDPIKSFWEYWNETGKFNGKMAQGTCRSNVSLRIGCNILLNTSLYKSTQINATGLLSLLSEHLHSIWHQWLLTTRRFTWTDWCATHDAWVSGAALEEELFHPIFSIHVLESLSDTVADLTYLRSCKASVVSLHKVRSPTEANSVGPTRTCCMDDINSRAVHISFVQMYFEQ